MYLARPQEATTQDGAADDEHQSLRRDRDQPELAPDGHAATAHRTAGNVRPCYHPALAGEHELRRDWSHRGHLGQERQRKAGAHQRAAEKHKITILINVDSGTTHNYLPT